MKVAYLFESTNSREILENMIIPQMEKGIHGADVVKSPQLAGFSITLTQVQIFIVFLHHSFHAFPRKNVNNHSILKGEKKRKKKYIKKTSQTLTISQQRKKCLKFVLVIKRTIKGLSAGLIGNWSILATMEYNLCSPKFPRWLSGKESTCQAADTGWIPGSGRSPGEGHGNPPRYSCLRIPMDGGAWQLQSIGSQRLGPD